MRVLEHFDRIVVLDDGTRAARALGDRLAADGYAPAVVALAAPGGWRAAFAEALAEPSRRSESGVLILAPHAGDDGTLWRTQDRLVERLEFRRWEVAFLGHDAGSRELSDGERPDLFECDAVPSGVTALAVSWRALDTVVQMMPDRAIDGPLGPGDWLTIASWLAKAALHSTRPLFAWPPLGRPQAGACP